MTTGTISMTPTLDEYLCRVGTAEPDLLRELRLETSHMPHPQMQIGPVQGQFMRWLVELIGATRCIEVGVFTGYSSTAVALSLPSDGLLIACDVDPITAAIAGRYWQRAGVASKIRLELRPASETLDALLDAGEAGSFDFAFVDADKESYDSYYEACLRLLRPNGVLLIDNTLWGGSVVDPRNQEPSTRAIVALNEKIRADTRVSPCLLPVGDGLTLVRKGSPGSARPARSP